MKIVYESIHRSLEKAIDEAVTRNRKIERIELTWFEANELAKTTMGFLGKSDRLFEPKDRGNASYSYMGIPVVIEI